MADSALIDFPDRLLRFGEGSLGRDDDGDWWIDIPLQPFSADDWIDPATFRPGTGGPEVIRTAIRLDHIELPADAATVEGLAHRTFTFPVNPEDGSIDGAVYLCAAHTMVDVTRIAFTGLRGGTIGAIITAYMAFEREGSGFRGRPAVIAARLAYDIGELWAAG